jgi:PmbA protein
MPIINRGTVCQYFVNTYMAAKMGIAPTIEDAIRPKVMPFPRRGLSRKDILALCGDGILVTDFNGGNSNSATGNFSYGIEGFAFKDGKITHPVRDMVVTGNFLDLWSHLVACGEDARLCHAKLVPTLAFSDVDFSA